MPLPPQVRPELLAVIVLLAIIAAGYLALFAAAHRKDRERRALLARLDGAMAALGAERLGDGLHRWNGRAYTIHADATPLLRRELSLRLAALAPGTAELELRRARNVPSEAAAALGDPYRGFVAQAPAGVDAPGFLMRPEVAGPLGSVMPGRWDAFSVHIVERVLYSNLLPHAAYDGAELRRDLEALGAIGRVAAERTERPERVTLRHGIEPDVPGWHWTPADRLRWGEKLSRSCVSAWTGTPHLNAALLDLFRRLAGPARLLVLMNRPLPEEVRLAYGSEAPAADGLTADGGEGAWVAADHFTDAAFFGGLLAADEAALPELRARFSGHAAWQHHRAALEALDRCLFYVRRLRDDEDSWYSGEYEILSERLSHEQVAAAVTQMGARLIRLERPFSHKLFRDDRLDVAL